MIALLLPMAAADTLPMVLLHDHVVILPPVGQALAEYYGEDWPECDVVPLEEGYGTERKIKAVHDPELGRVSACVCPPGCEQDDCGYVVEVGLFSSGLVCDGECSQPPMVPESPADPQDFEGQEEEPKEEDESPTCPAGMLCEEETMRISDPNYHAWIMEALK